MRTEPWPDERTAPVQAFWSLAVFCPALGAGFVRAAEIVDVQTRTPRLHRSGECPASLRHGSIVPSISRITLRNSSTTEAWKEFDTKVSE